MLFPGLVRKGSWYGMHDEDMSDLFDFDERDHKSVEDPLSPLFSTDLSLSSTK